MRQSRAKLPQRDFVPTAIKVDFPRGRCETAPERGEPRAVEAMSASSTEADTTPFPRQVRCGSFSDLAPSPSQVRSSPNNRHAATASPRPLRAKLGSRCAHSISSSARASSNGGMASPCAFAVFRLIEDQSVKLSPNIGRPLFDSARAASSWRTSQCSANTPSAMRTMSAAYMPANCG
jgi:hypothetical protein